MPIHLEGVTLHPERYPTREAYPFSLPVFQTMGELALDAPVTCFVGENGTGKSTLLEAIARRCRIHIWRREARTRYERNPHEERLHLCMDLAWADGPVPGSFFASQTFRHFARLLEEWAAADPGQLTHFGGRSLLTQSHGQSLMAFFRSRYARRGLYLLDEPETALSPRTQVDLVRLLRDAGRDGQAQFIVATHSPILLACPGARLYSFDRAPVAPVRYENTPQVRVTRAFLADPGRFLDGEDPGGAASGG